VAGVLAWDSVSPRAHFASAYHTLSWCGCVGTKHERRPCVHFSRNPAFTLADAAEMSVPELEASMPAARPRHTRASALGKRGSR
jgi:hypothetical protein